jgi:rhomboid protease GluP
MFGKPKKLVMCQSCRAFVDPGENVCPHCGLESVPVARARAGEEASAFFSMLILAINILLFVAITGVEIKNGRGGEALMNGASSPVLLEFGSFYRGLINLGEWWRFITPNFLHIGLLHVLFNSYALYQVGPLTEEIYGSTKFIFIYLITGIVAWIASYFFNIAGAGASGAICGLIGLMAVYGYRQGGTFGKSLMRSMVQWGLMTIIFGFIVGANNVAHAGGLISGAILGYVIKGEHPRSSTSSKVWNGVAIICVALILVSFAMVGKNYGVQMERMRQFEANRNRQQLGAENIIALSRFVHDADQAIKAIPSAQNPNEARQIAKQLKELSEKVSSLPSIDEESNIIRAQLTSTLNDIAASLAPNNSNTALSTKPYAEIQAAWDNRLKSYLGWEDSVIADYGLVRGN